jgi:hypothetical protein
MKKIFFTVLLFMLVPLLYGQEATFNDPQGNLLRTVNLKPLPPSKMILVNPNNKCKYYLDSTRIYLKAICTKGDTLWITDPWKDSKLPKYRTVRPIIMDLGFKKLDESIAKLYHLKSDALVIWIAYHNSQFGFITLNNGKFYFEGQD